jgi:hypothetical protein
VFQGNTEASAYQAMLRACRNAKEHHAEAGSEVRPLIEQRAGYGNLLIK